VSSPHDDDEAKSEGGSDSAVPVPADAAKSDASGPAVTEGATPDAVEDDAASLAAATSDPPATAGPDATPTSDAPAATDGEPDDDGDAPKVRATGSGPLDEEPFDTARRERAELETQSAPADLGPIAEPRAAAAVAAVSTPPRRGIRWWWILPALLLIEFYVFGRHGYVEVCVGKADETDFTLSGEPRNDENRWKFPTCEERQNLGLRSHYDERVTEAVGVACNRATIFRFRGQKQACVDQKDGWKQEVRTRFCWPWDPNYYEHLFWFLK
jgi:hypothetical protein